MSFNIIPLEILTEILLHVVEQRDLTHSLRLQLISKRFAAQIPQVLITSKKPDRYLDWQCDTSFWRAYLVQVIRRGRTTGCTVVDEFAHTIRELYGPDAIATASPEDELHSHIWELCGFFLKWKEKLLDQTLQNMWQTGLRRHNVSLLWYYIAMNVLDNAVRSRELDSKIGSNLRVHDNLARYLHGWMRFPLVGLSGDIGGIQALIDAEIGDDVSYVNCQEIELATIGAVMGGHLDAIQLMIPKLDWQVKNIPNGELGVSGLTMFSTRNVSCLRFMLETYETRIWDEIDRDINPVFEEGFFASLWYTVHAHNHVESARYLKEIIVSRDEKVPLTKSTLEKACTNGWTEMVQLLCDLDTSQNHSTLSNIQESTDILARTVAKGHFATVSILLRFVQAESIANSKLLSVYTDLNEDPPNEFSSCPLLMAIQADHKRLFKLLKSKGHKFQTTKCGEHALLMAICEGDIGWVRIILDEKVVPDIYAIDTAKSFHCVEIEDILRGSMVRSAETRVTCCLRFFRGYTRVVIQREVQIAIAKLAKQIRRIWNRGEQNNSTVHLRSVPVLSGELAAEHDTDMSISIA